jgi:hypothetical protein
LSGYPVYGPISIWPFQCAEKIDDSSCQEIAANQRVEASVNSCASFLR